MLCICIPIMYHESWIMKHENGIWSRNKILMKYEVRRAARVDTLPVKCPFPGVKRVFYPPGENRILGRGQNEASINWIYTADPYHLIWILTPLVWSQLIFRQHLFIRKFNKLLYPTSITYCMLKRTLYKLKFNRLLCRFFPFDSVAFAST